MMSKHKLKSKGFILIEALLAVVILGTGITLVVQSLSASRRNVAYSLDYTRALFVLENEFVKMFQSSTSTQSSTDDKTIQDESREYDFKTQSGSLQTQDSENLKDIQVDLSWKSGRRENVLSLNTYVFTPPNENQQ